MYFTYDKVKNDIWEIIKDKMDFVYEPSSECRVCEQHNEWEFDPEAFGGEPPLCKAHYDGDACRYFYASDKYDSSDYDAPACVVGNWFFHNKFTTEDLNVSTWEQLEGKGVDTVINQSNIDLDEHAMSLLHDLQQNQDMGMSWGNAYERSIANLEAGNE